MIQGQYRYAVLQIPEAVTPLKFRGHARKEIEAVQATAGDQEDIILVRLFVLERILFGLGQKKVDSILNGIVAKCPNIQRIELEPLARPLTAEEMQEAAAEAQANLEEMTQRMLAMKGLGGPASGSR